MDRGIRVGGFLHRALGDPSQDLVVGSKDLVDRSGTVEGTSISWQSEPFTAKGSTDARHNAG